MAVGGDDTLDLAPAAVATLVPRLAYELVDRHGPTGVAHEEIDGTLVSADISGFTRLTEELADRGREGAEIITIAVNSCFEDLIEAAEFHGGDVLKFGGDAVLVLFTGAGHRVRAASASQEMQFALRRNAHAKRHQLLMTVGVSDGPFHAMLLGGRRRDVLLCGPSTTETLVLEDGAEKGEVVASSGVRAAMSQSDRAGGWVILDDRQWLMVDRPEVSNAAVNRFVSTELRSHWAEYADLGAAHRQAAIGFVSIGGIDDFIEEFGGEPAARALSALLDEIHGILETTGAVIVHSDMAIGGVKLLIGAGVPSSIDGPADALLHSALEISRLETPFPIRQGLNAGAVFAGFLGATHRRTFTVMSDMVNTAARMVGPAAPGEVVAVDALVARARGQVQAEPLEPLMVKGKTELVNALRVTGLVAGRDLDVEVDFTGRDDELTALTSAVADGQAVTIVGPAGSGKSRLTDEGIEGDGVVDSSGGRYMSATPYGAFWRGLRELLDIGASLRSTEAGTALREVLERDYADLAPMAALLAPVVGGEAEESAEVASIDPEFRRDVFHDALAELLGRQDPPVRAVVLEDTQWLDDASRELIAYLRSVGNQRGWVVVQSRRTSDVDAGDDAGGVRVELGPLDDVSIRAIITQACERQLLRHELDRLVGRAQGNPLFALELARAVGRPGEDIPGSIEEVIGARIDRLPDRQRQSVRLASVLGARFAATTFEALAAASGYDVEVDVASIAEVFDVDDEGLVGFKQLLYQDVAYASLPFERRKRLHRTVGEHLETTVDDLDAISALLSQHFHASGDRRRCWKYSLQAAERATRQHSPGDAITLYRRALEFAPRGIPEEERADAQEGFGNALVAAGNLEEAYEAFKRARRLASESTRRLQLQCRQAECRDRQGRFGDAMRAYARVLSDDDTAPRERATALVGRASVLHRQGRHADSYAAAHEALAVASAASLRHLEGRSLQLVAVSGGPIEAADTAAANLAALEAFAELGELSSEAEVRNNLGVMAQQDGKLDEAADQYRSSLELKKRVGDLSGAAMVEMNLGEVELDRGNTDGISSLLQSCLSTFERVGFTIGAAFTQGLLGRCALMEGDPHGARDLLEGSSQLFLELGAEVYSAEMDLLLADALIDLGDVAGARRVVALNRLRLERDVFDSVAIAEQRLQALEERLGR